MGKQVTVDSDDLDKIVMATGIVKQFEMALKQHKGDPFVAHDPEMLKDAHDRLAAELRRATRDVHPDNDDPVSIRSFTLMKDLDGKINLIDHVKIKSDLYRELHSKSMIEYGNMYEVIYWADTQKQENTSSMAKLVVKLTPRGKKLLHDMELLDHTNLDAIQ